MQEGIDVFDTIWDKVYSAPTQAQKEKYESDLKKEIKKLQRFRDQIKVVLMIFPHTTHSLLVKIFNIFFFIFSQSWISSNDVKSKKNLIECRQLIESKMEQFKICEKETKTKAYSKEGLAMQDKLDPAVVERERCTRWVSEQIDTLNELVDEAEAELEAISAQSSKKRNKGSGMVNTLQEYLRSHRWHIDRLEHVNRMVHNEVLEPPMVDELKDGLEYYLESFHDPDFFPDPGMYDFLELDDKDEVCVSFSDPHVTCVLSVPSSCFSE